MKRAELRASAGRQTSREGERCGCQEDEIPLQVKGISCGQGLRRSVDLRFFRPALYRLSYLTGRLTLTDPAGGNDGI